MKYLPGFVGAIAAFVALRAMAWLGVNALGWHIAVFLASYVIVTVAVDQAMTRYGTTAKAA